MVSRRQGTHSLYVKAEQAENIVRIWFAATLWWSERKVGGSTPTIQALKIKTLFCDRWMKLIV